MFQLLPCTICQRTFSLRKDVPEDALLKCPNCGNQFRLGDVLDAFYSPWIVLEDAQSNGPDPKANTSGGMVSNSESLSGTSETGRAIGAPTDSVLSFDNLLQTHDEPQVPNNRNNAITDDPAELAADDVYDSNESFAVDELEMQDTGLELESTDDSAVDNLDTDRNEIQALQLDSRPEASVKKPRPRRSDRGGLWSIIQVVLGGAAAVPVTLLLLWYVIGKDVANAGPTVAQFAPWIVPKKFHSPVENLRARSGPRVPPPALGEGGFRNFDEELGKKPGDVTSDTDLAVNAPAPTSVASPETAEEAAMRTALELVNDTKQKIKEWNPQAPDKNETISGVFDDLVGVANQLAILPQEGDALKLLKDSLKSVGRFVATQDVRLLFASLQAKQFDSKSPPATAGRVYLGLAKEVAESDSHWMVTGLDKTVINVPKKTVETLPEGQKFFCLGTETVEASEPGAPKVVRISASFYQPL